MVTGAFERGELGFTLPDGQLLRVTLYPVRAPKIRLEKGKAEVELFFEADPFGPESLPMQSDTLRAFLEDRLKTELEAVFSAVQRVDSDVMGFGRFAAKRFFKASDWEQYDWKADYRTLTVSFSVSVMLSHNPHDPEME